jgi:hypothetical protein
MKNDTIWKVILGLIFYLFPFVLMLRFLFSGVAKKIIVDMPGEDGKWQWNEIWEGVRIFMALGSWWAVLTMIFLIAIFKIDYPAEAWIVMMITMTGTAGNEALRAFLKYKIEIKKHAV